MLYYKLTQGMILLDFQILQKEDVPNSTLEVFNLNTTM